MKRQHTQCLPRISSPQVFADQHPSLLQHVTIHGRNCLNVELQRGRAAMMHPSRNAFARVRAHMLIHCLRDIIDWNTPTLETEPINRDTVLAMGQPCMRAQVAISR